MKWSRLSLVLLAGIILAGSCRLLFPSVEIRLVNTTDLAVTAVSWRTNGTSMWNAVNVGGTIAAGDAVVTELDRGIVDLSFEFQDGGTGATYGVDLRKVEIMVIQIGVGGTE